MFLARLSMLTVVAAGVALSACSGPENGPGGVAISDDSCAKLRSELNALDRRGVPGLIEAQNNGRTKFSSQQASDIDRYNKTLDTYLGGQCASEQRYKAKVARR
jgi:hypothetical protein